MTTCSKLFINLVTQERGRGALFRRTLGSRAHSARTAAAPGRVLFIAKHHHQHPSPPTPVLLESRPTLPPSCRVRVRACVRRVYVHTCAHKYAWLAEQERAEHSTICTIEMRAPNETPNVDACDCVNGYNLNRAHESALAIHAFQCTYIRRTVLFF